MKEHIFLVVLLVLSFFAVYVLGTTAHELTHYWQNDFQGSEICFFGHNNLTGFDSELGGWYVTYNDTFNNRIFPQVDNIEPEAYMMTWGVRGLGWLIIFLLWWQVASKMRGYEMERKYERGKKETEKEI